MDAPTITLGELEVTLVEPSSVFCLMTGRTQEQLETDGHDIRLTHGAASLRMSWPKGVAWPVRVTPREWVPGQKVALYGYQIWEDLRRGTKGTVSISELRDACHTAQNWATVSAMTEAEIKQIVGFSEAQGEEE